MNPSAHAWPHEYVREECHRPQASRGGVLESRRRKPGSVRYASPSTTSLIGSNHSPLIVVRDRLVPYPASPTFTLRDCASRARGSALARLAFAHSRARHCFKARLGRFAAPISNARHPLIAAVAHIRALARCARAPKEASCSMVRLKLLHHDGTKTPGKGWLHVPRPGTGHAVHGSHRQLVRCRRHRGATAGH